MAVKFKKYEADPKLKAEYDVLVVEEKKLDAALDAEEKHLRSAPEYLQLTQLADELSIALRGHKHDYSDTGVTKKQAAASMAERIDRRQEEVASAFISASRGSTNVYYGTNQYSYGIQTNIRDSVLEIISKVGAPRSKLRGSTIEALVQEMVDRAVNGDKVLKELRRQEEQMDDELDTLEARLVKLRSSKLSEELEKRGRDVSRRLSEIVEGATRPELAAKRKEREDANEGVMTKVDAIYAAVIAEREREKVA